MFWVGFVGCEYRVGIYGVVSESTSRWEYGAGSTERNVGAVCYSFVIQWVQSRGEEKSG